MRRAAPLLVVLLAMVVWPGAASAVGPGVLTGFGCIGDDSLPSSTICAQTTPGLKGLAVVVVSPDGRDVYAGSNTDDAVVHLRRSNDGTLTPVGCVEDDDVPVPGACAQAGPGLGSVSDLALTPDGKTLLATSATGESTLARLDRDPSTGALTAGGCIADNDSSAETCSQSTDGLSFPEAVAVSPDGRDVYVTSVGDDAVTQIRRDPETRALTPAGCVDDNDAGQGPDTCASSVDGLNATRGVAVAPDGRNVYAVGSDDDALVRFVRNPTTGVLTAGGCIDDNDAGQGPDACAASTDALNDPRFLVVSADGANIYVGTSGDRAINTFERAADGTITFEGCVRDPSSSEPCSVVAAGLTAPGGIAVSADGRFVYSAGRAVQAVVSLRRTSDGSLTPIGCIQAPPQVGCARQTPGLAVVTSVSVSPDGRDVYVASDIDNAVVHLIGERPPVCTGRSSAGAPGAAQSVPLDCTDPNGDQLTIAAVDAPGSGALGAIDQGAGTVGYTPAPGFSGLDTFTFQAIADGAKSNVATASVLVQSATGPAGAPGASGPQGLSGPPGANGINGAQGEPAIKLLALLGADKLSAKRGKRVSFRVGVTAPGTATIEILKGRKVQATIRKTLSKQGRASIVWNGKAGRKAAPAGNYTVRLTVKGTDGQSATDSARLKLTR